MLEGAADDGGTRGIGFRGARLEVADIARAQARVGDLGEPPGQRGVLLGEREAAVGGDGVGVRRPDLRHQRQGVPDEALPDGARVQARRIDARRALDEQVEGVLQREFQLLGTPREEQREDGIAQQSRLDEIGAGDAEIGQRRLKGRAVPQRDRDRFVLRQAVAEVHVRRERRLAVDADARRCGSRADGGIDVERVSAPPASMRRPAPASDQRCGKRREDGSPGPPVAADRGS